MSLCGVVLQETVFVFRKAQKYFALQAGHLHVAILAQSATSTFLNMNGKMIASVESDVKVEVGQLDGMLDHLPMMVIKMCKPMNCSISDGVVFSSGPFFIAAYRLDW